MNYKTRGIITAIGEVKSTGRGIAVQKIHFEQENSMMFYPQCLGTKIDLLDNFLPGDVAEIEFYIAGSQGGNYNNVIIDKITRL